MKIKVDWLTYQFRQNKPQVLPFQFEPCIFHFKFYFFYRKKLFTHVGFGWKTSMPFLVPNMSGIDNYFPLNEDRLGIIMRASAFLQWCFQKLNNVIILFFIEFSSFFICVGEGVRAPTSTDDIPLWLPHFTTEMMHWAKGMLVFSKTFLLPH